MLKHFDQLLLAHMFSVETSDLLLALRLLAGILIILRSLVDLTASASSLEIQQTNIEIADRKTLENSNSRIGNNTFSSVYFVEKWRCKYKTIYVKLLGRMFEISGHI